LLFCIFDRINTALLSSISDLFPKHKKYIIDPKPLNGNAYPITLFSYFIILKMYVSAPQISAENPKRFTDYILAHQLVLLKER